MSRTDQVKVATLGSSSGDEDIEYWRILMGGSIAKKSPRDNAADGYSSSISSGDRLLSKISVSKPSLARYSIFSLTSGSGVLEAIFATFYKC